MNDKWQLFHDGRKDMITDMITDMRLAVRNTRVANEEDLTLNGRSVLK